MLAITITPTMLVFKDVSDEMQEEIGKYCDLSWSAKTGYLYTTGTPAQLYNILFKLSYKYDIELT